MTDTPEADDDEPEIVIAAVNDHYYLLEGDDHLYAMLNGKGGYPTPALCLKFRDMEHFRENLTHGSVGRLWQVHPEVMARMRRAGELEEIPFIPAT